MNMEAKKTALRHFQYGLFIYTSKSTGGSEGQPYAASTVTWVSQASFEPPLVMIALRRDSWSHEATRQSGKFALNLVAHDQKAFAGRFFKELVLEGRRINGFDFKEGITGSPIFDEALAALECQVVDKLEHGDHTVIVGEVIEAYQLRSGIQALNLADTGWKYGG